MTTYVNNAIADAMFIDLANEATLTRRPITPHEATAIIAEGVVTAFNPSHATTTTLVERRTGVAIPVAQTARRIKLGIGDRVLVVTMDGPLPRATREWSEEEIKKMNFSFALWTVVG